MNTCKFHRWPVKPANPFSSQIRSIEAYEEREKMLAHRASILAAEAERLAGAPTYSVDEVRAKLKEKYSHA